MKYIDAELLRAETEKLRRIQRAIGDSAINSSTRRFFEGTEDMCDLFLSLIDLLQQEQPEVDLEKEIDLCWQDWISPSNQSSVEGVLPKSEFSMYARHFYELGLNARKEE